MNSLLKPSGLGVFILPICLTTISISTTEKEFSPIYLVVDSPCTSFVNIVVASSSYDCIHIFRFFEQSLSSSIEGGAKWLVNKMKGAVTKLLWSFQLFFLFLCAFVCNFIVSEILFTTDLIFYLSVFSFYCRWNSLSFCFF